MSDKATTLRKRRTVRLSCETDLQIQAVAAQKGKTVSEVIREILETEFSTLMGNLPDSGCYKPPASHELGNQIGSLAPLTAGALESHPR